MSKITTLLDRLGKKREKAARNEDESRLFTEYYHAFRELLHHNHVVLQTMGDMQEKAGGEYLFDRAYIRASCREVLSGIEHIIGRLNFMADNRYADLIVPYQHCTREIQAQIDPKIEVPDGPYVVPVDSVKRTDLPAVGGKFAQLGEIAREAAFQVPDGFVITTTAFKAFMRHNRIGAFVESLLDRLDVRDYDALQATAKQIQTNVFSGEVPPEVSSAVEAAYADLCRRCGRPDLKVAVRSSSLQEDIVASFAGQYHSELNVPFSGLLSAYKGILVSLFSPRAVFYFKDQEFRIDNMAMAVGVMSMVEARFSGVLYSRDPAAVAQDRVLINAVRGLGPYAVDGTVPADVYEVRKGGDPEILVRESGRQDRKLVCDADQGLREEVLAAGSVGLPCLDEDRIRSLVDVGRRLESLFGGPQDVEWAVDRAGRIFLLQSRPLRAAAPTIAEKGKRPKIEGHRVLLEGGTVICRGAAAGRVNILSRPEDAAGFDPGDILVIRHSHPEFAVLLKKAAAVVSDIGTPLGHLATVAREYRVPTLFNTKTATRALEAGSQVTVDAVYATVYEGRVEAVLNRPRPNKGPQDVPVLRQLREILTHITPLHLTDPRSPDFSPQGCRTLHDITRFCHEAALRTMFSLSQEGWFSDQSARQLVADMPLQWWVIDLGGGIRKKSRRKTVRVEDLTSIPMQALWQGMTAVAWKGPPPVDTKGFLSTIMSAMTNPDTEPTVNHGMADRNYILVAADFLNMSTRLGFHFSTVESFIGESDTQNYISFVFTGGGADDGRKQRRARLIARLLERFDFRVEARGETVFARIESNPRPIIENRLRVLGHILVHTRQMDMVMYNDKMVDWYYRQMAADIEAHAREELR
ncbi:MAG: PEP/pyruvate-binding domain-containing protein [Desulfobacterales bacterium]|jgi:pyruvate,water dikinase